MAIHGNTKQRDCPVVPCLLEGGASSIYQRDVRWSSAREVCQLGSARLERLEPIKCGK